MAAIVDSTIAHGERATVPFDATVLDGIDADAGADAIYLFAEVRVSYSKV